jgi:hypothetical protein
MTDSEMPRYFFHLHCATKTVPDSSGADLRDPDQAWEAARATARDLMQGQTDAEVNWLTCFFKVTDESGEILFELPFSECVEVKKLPN